MKTFISKPISVLLLIGSAAVLAGCHKRSMAPVPEPDMELQSSIDMSFATSAITDIDMICSFMGVGSQPLFYSPSPVSPNGPMKVIGNTNSPQIVASFNSTHGVDGHVRDGTIFMTYENSNPNARYYHAYKFAAKVGLLSYKVDGWLISTVGGKPCTITNQLVSSAYDPSVTRLSWLIEGEFEFTHPNDPSRNMVWKGKLVKTLQNTNDAEVFTAAHYPAIKWEKAIVNYTGQASGVTTADVPFSMVISGSNPLQRDFTCSPDPVGGVTSQPVVKSWKNESHPFVSGIVTFNTGDRYPRQIYYGNETSPQLPRQCDNSGEVLIKGISYRVDFMK